VAKVSVTPGGLGDDAIAWAKMLQEMYAEWDGDISHEAGVHRLVRISPFDAKSRRFTCFAQVTVGLDHGPDYFHDGPVRSYVLDPYERVVDHRLIKECADAKAVLAGDLSLILEGKPKEETA
jgi:protein subunit release factor B